MHPIGDVRSRRRGYEARHVSLDAKVVKQGGDGATCSLVRLQENDPRGVATDSLRSQQNHREEKNPSPPPGDGVVPHLAHTLSARLVR